MYNDWNMVDQGNRTRLEVIEKCLFEPWRMTSWTTLTLGVQGGKAIPSLQHGDKLVVYIPDVDLYDDLSRRVLVLLRVEHMDGREVVFLIIESSRFNREDGTYRFCHPGLNVYYVCMLVDAEEYAWVDFVTKVTFPSTPSIIHVLTS